MAAHDELRRLIRQSNGSKGIRHSELGFGFGSSVKQHAISGHEWLAQPLVRHELSGLVVHHERLNIRRIRWHLDNYGDLINGVRPMYLLIHDGRRYIVDGCHRTAALLLSGVTDFAYLTWDSDSHP
jgi:hypothetical protein